MPSVAKIKGQGPIKIFREFLQRKKTQKQIVQNMAHLLAPFLEKLYLEQYFLANDAEF